MNKYEEALNTILDTNVWNNSITIKIKHLIDDKNIDLLKELVKRATPMKPINQCNRLGGWSGICVCLNAVVFDTQNHCWYCGQALDWSDK